MASKASIANAKSSGLLQSEAKTPTEPEIEVNVEELIENLYSLNNHEVRMQVWAKIRQMHTDMMAPPEKE